MFATFFNVHNSDLLPQGNCSDISMSTPVDTQPTAASQPTLTTTNAQVSNAINMAGQNPAVKPKKKGMTKDERIVHDCIRGFYKRVTQVGSFLGTACVFDSLRFTVDYCNFLFNN